MAIFLHKPILGNFTIVGPLIWCDNPQVRLWMISNINNNDFHHLGKSQICAGADHYFSPSKPHSGKLCMVSMMCVVCINTCSDLCVCTPHSYTAESRRLQHLRPSNSPRNCLAFLLLLPRGRGISDTTRHENFSHKINFVSWWDDIRDMAWRLYSNSERCRGVVS